jgi:hypothetical protein
MNIEQAVSHEYKIASHDKDITLLNISSIESIQIDSKSFYDGILFPKNQNYLL